MPQYFKFVRWMLTSSPKIIIGFFFTPPLFLATKVAISFVYYTPKTIKCTQKPKIKIKKFTGIDQSSERVPFSTSYLPLAVAHALNSRDKKEVKCWNLRTTSLPHGNFGILILILIPIAWPKILDVLDCA